MEPLSFTAPLPLTLSSGIRYEELGKDASVQNTGLTPYADRTYGKSPCFMYQSPEEIDQSLIRAESGDSRIFAVLSGGSAIACLELSASAETFVSETGGIRNICGAYCLPRTAEKVFTRGS